MKVQLAHSNTLNLPILKTYENLAWSVFPHTVHTTPSKTSLSIMLIAMLLPIEEQKKHFFSNFYFNIGVLENKKAQQFNVALPLSSISTYFLADPFLGSTFLTAFDFFRISKAVYLAAAMVSRFTLSIILPRVKSTDRM